MKNSFVADTMALVLRLESRKLPSEIKSLFEHIENEKAGLIIPAMVLVEIGYLAEKRRIETNLKEVNSYKEKHAAVKIQPLTEEIIEKAFEINDIPEIHDRIIAATAKYLNAELITNDPVIAKSRHLKVKWRNAKKRGNG